jgi:spermidine synthase
VRALHLGGGGMTLPRYLAAARPGSRSVVLEVDGGVVDLVRRELPTRPEADIRVRVGDARVLVRDEPTGSYDLVVGDAFGGIAVPWHLTTVDMIEQVQRVLTPDGVYAANVIDRPPAAFLRAEIATVRAVFPHVAVLAPPAYLEGRDGGNFVVVASDRPLPVDAALDRARQRGTGYAALEGAALARFVGDAEVLTDDHAPVDQLITPFG